MINTESCSVAHAKKWLFIVVGKIYIVQNVKSMFRTQPIIDIGVLIIVSHEKGDCQMTQILKWVVITTYTYMYKLSPTLRAY